MSATKRRIIEIENVLHPGKLYKVDGDKYDAMQRAFLEVLPTEVPGWSAAEINEKVVPLLPEELFPGGATAGWWVAAVQLDLEAKGVIKRVGARPIRFHRL